MKKFLILICLVSFCSFNANAQKSKKKKVVKKEVKKEEVPEKTPQEKLYDELLPSTARVMFIDSVVVDKDSFLEHLPFTHEMGKVAMTETDYVYTNEFGDTRLSAKGDTITGRHIYLSHRYGQRWDNDDKLQELESNTINPDYPFLMANGITLYFSAEGENTVGGRDIFRTTYNAEDAEFYEATNMGLPFNSPANEYMLAISDYDDLGWLVSDRNQPEGKVCIYTFEPLQQRVTFGDDIEEAKLKSYASIEHIKDTWKFGDRQEALRRKAEMESRMGKRAANEAVFFVVNDNVVYHSLDDFKSANGAKRYQEIESKKRELEQLNTLLDATRLSYNDATNSRRNVVGRQIVSLEQEILGLEQDIKSQEKDLRRSENK